MRSFWKRMRPKLNAIVQSQVAIKLLFLSQDLAQFPPGFFSLFLNRMVMVPRFLQGLSMAGVDVILGMNLIGRVCKPKCTRRPTNASMSRSRRRDKRMRENANACTQTETQNSTCPKEKMLDLGFLSIPKTTVTFVQRK
ncbi:hypothetical protein EDD85DRAFT_797406 [Armillaria nabsnona]|nr:hypothetical protein EDD85DRAFT_797406 [Armillaria nabsnona]